MQARSNDAVHHNQKLSLEINNLQKLEQEMVKTQHRMTDNANKQKEIFKTVKSDLIAQKDELLTLLYQDVSSTLILYDYLPGQISLLITALIFGIDTVLSLQQRGNELLEEIDCCLKDIKQIDIEEFTLDKQLSEAKHKLTILINKSHFLQEQKIEELNSTSNVTAFKTGSNQFSPSLFQAKNGNGKNQDNKKSSEPADTFNFNV